MKRVKILALVMALLMLAAAFASCKSAPKQTMTCTVSVTAPDGRHWAKEFNLK